MPAGNDFQHKSHGTLSKTPSSFGRLLPRSLTYFRCDSKTDLHYISIELSLSFCQVDGEKGYSSFFVIARLSYRVFSPSLSSYDGRHAVTASTSLPWFVLSKMKWDVLPTDEGIADGGGVRGLSSIITTVTFKPVTQIPNRKHKSTFQPPPHYQNRLSGFQASLKHAFRLGLLPKKLVWRSTRPNIMLMAS
jgi:hypothetical protein